MAMDSELIINSLKGNVNDESVERSSLISQTKALKFKRTFGEELWQRKWQRIDGV